MLLFVLEEAFPTGNGAFLLPSLHGPATTGASRRRLGEILFGLGAAYPTGNVAFLLPGPPRSCSPYSTILVLLPGIRGPAPRYPRSCSSAPRSCSPVPPIRLPGPSDPTPRAPWSCSMVSRVQLPRGLYGLTPWPHGPHHPGLYGLAPLVPPVLLPVPAVLDLLLRSPTVLLPGPPGPDPAPRSHSPGPVLRSLRSDSPYPMVFFHGIPRSCSPWSLRFSSLAPHGPPHPGLYSPAPRSRGPGPAPRSHSPVPWYPAVLLLGLHGPSPASRSPRS
nr:PREDICTED: basic proline-rich protein-like [Bemisia tabaci]